VALLIAISCIAVLTAVAMDVAYNTRVSLQMAANARDELRATYLAKSAVAMSRLVLHFQQQLDQTTAGAGGALPPAVTQALGGGAGAAGSPLAGLLGGKLAVRLWDLVPIDSGAAALLLAGRPGDAHASFAPEAAHAPERPGDGAGNAAPPLPGADAPPAAKPVAFGDMEGAFQATIEDEESKVNVRQFDGFDFSAAAQAARLADLVKDPRWDFLFDEDDANGWRVERKDLFAAIKDWEDIDEVSSSYTGDPLKPFSSGFGDENALYDRLADRYKAKNAPFDSLDELYMVGGVTDAFMQAFGDKLTVYPDVGATINVNSTDPQQLMLNAVLMADPPGVPQPALVDPAFLTKLQAALALVRPLPFMSITPQQFATALQGLGVRVGASFFQANAAGSRNPFGDHSSTFHIRAEGISGEVHKTIDVVVTFDRRAEALAQDQGRLLHWHEE
jgi:general secretion pathway protein K